MQIEDLKSLIRECIHEILEEFDEEGWMNAVNISEKEEESED